MKREYAWYDSINTEWMDKHQLWTKSEAMDQLRLNDSDDYVISGDHFMAHTDDDEDIIDLSMVN